MMDSIGLVGQGYRTFAEVLAQGGSAADLVPIGRRYEALMFERFATNTHKGAIFLGGLLLCALSGCAGRCEDLRPAVMAVAAQMLPAHDTGETHGARLRLARKSGGILDEARRGLPALFEAALPAIAATRTAGGNETREGLAALAALMQHVEDTTALHRCGPMGLERLRRDGAQLEWLLTQGVDPWPFLLAANREYIAMRLTMGGVADLLAMAFGLSEFAPSLTFATLNVVPLHA